MNDAFRRALVVSVTWAVVTVGAFALGLWVYGSWHDEWSGFNASIEEEYCNIAIVPIQGEIIAYPGANKDGFTSESDLPPTTNPADIISVLVAAEADPDILGILLQVDSSGGVPAASEAIANAVRSSSKPVVASVGEAALSGGYLISTGADAIVASAFSDIGSIGVTMSYLENTARNTKEGLGFVSLSSAQFKDYGSPDKPLTSAERALLERDLNVLHQQFVKEVAQNREMELEIVTKLADGSSMPGELALKAGLIDGIGDESIAIGSLVRLIGLSPEEVVLCR